MADIEMLVFSTWTTADPLVLLAIKLSTVLFTVFQGATSILLLNALAKYGVLAAAVHLALLNILLALQANDCFKIMRCVRSITAKSC